MQLLRLSRNGGLWIGTDRGLIHIHHGRADVFSQADGLSVIFIWSLFEDREGNVLGRLPAGGLDRFQGFAIPSPYRQAGLSER